MDIKNVKKVTDYPYLNLFQIAYTDRLENEKNYIFASRSQSPNPLDDENLLPDAVVVVPYHIDREKLVMIEEYRVALNGFQYGFPAGLIDEGETVEQAGIRELHEETGLSVTQVLKQSPKVFSSSGMTDESISLLFVECHGTPTHRFNEASEEIRVKMVSQKEAKDILFDPEIRFDVKSWIVLNIFAAQGVL